MLNNQDSGTKHQMIFIVSRSISIILDINLGDPHSVPPYQYAHRANSL